MSLTGPKANVARTAHLTAWARALGRLTAGEAANGDYMAAGALLPYQRVLNRAPNLTRWLLERGLPGAFGYFNARTQYFDEVLLQEARAGVEQVVILGAGFDSRSFRFDDVAAFTRPLGLTVRSDIDAGTLENRFLSSLPGGRIRAWDCMRVAHAQHS